MSAKKVLNPDQFRLEPDTDSDTHSLDAYHDSFGGGKVPVGTLTWSRSSGAIHNVVVQPDYQRNGLATHMFNTAQSFSPPARRAATTEFTSKGLKWVTSIGGAA